MTVVWSACSTWPVRCAWVDRPLVDLPDEQAAAWRTWLHRHELNPMLIPLDSEIICDDEARTITVEEIQFDDAGGYLINRQTRRFDTCERVLQLEAPALGLPIGGYSVGSLHRQ